jgi:TonB family protein
MDMSPISQSCAALMACGSAAGLAAGPGAPLEPTTKWQMDYAPGECRLLRTFGEGKDAVTVQFSRLDPAPHIEIGLIGRSLPSTPSPVSSTLSTTTVTSVDATAQGFAAAGPSLASIRYQPNSRIGDALRSDVASGAPTRLGVAFTPRFAIALNLGSMKAPLAALDTCIDDLVTTWGLDPAEQRWRKSAPEPVGDVAAWFRPADYPAALNRSFAGGIVVVRLIVAADGRVTDCAVPKAGGDKAFETLTCRLATERARFTPAKGADGQPIASVWARRIAWQPAAPMVVRGS